MLPNPRLLIIQLLSRFRGCLEVVGLESETKPGLRILDEEDRQLGLADLAQEGELTLAHQLPTRDQSGDGEAL